MSLASVRAYFRANAPEIDIIETEDMPTEFGSAAFKGWRGGRDAASVHALRRAGAIIVGHVEEDRGVR